MSRRATLQDHGARAIRNATKRALQMRTAAGFCNALQRALQMCHRWQHRNALAAIRVAEPFPGSQSWWRRRTGHSTGCVICGGALPTVRSRYGPARVHGNRLTCSNACRQRAYRIMQSPEVRAERARRKGEMP